MPVRAGLSNLNLGVQKLCFCQLYECLSYSTYEIAFLLKWVASHLKTDQVCLLWKSFKVSRIKVYSVYQYNFILQHENNIIFRKL